MRIGRSWVKPRFAARPHRKAEISVSIPYATLDFENVHDDSGDHFLVSEER